MQDLNKNRFKIFIGVISFAFVIYILKIASLQLYGDQYERKAINNALNKITLYPSRSVIYDRNNEIIVKNFLLYDLFAFPKELDSTNRNIICDILEIDTLEYERVLLNAWIQSKKRRKNNAYDRSALFYANLNERQYSLLRENLYRLRGFYIEPRTDRSYNVTGGAHAIGYLGEVSEELIQDDPYYQPGDLVGITGIEKFYEPIFRGIKGTKTVWQDRTYRERGEVNNDSFNIPATAGPDVVSTLDIKLQRYAEELFVGKRGSIVAIEPQTGEVLVFLNKPDFDPNKLVGKDRNREFRKMLVDPKKPLYNRAVKGVYPPGSTVKTVLALIGLQEGIIQPESRKWCSGGYHMGSITVGCHGHPSPLDVEGSIQISCNAYYCDLFREIIDHPKYGHVHEGYKVLERHWRSFGLGSPTGIDLMGESNGNIPSVEKLAKRHGKKWRSSQVVSLGIGQGEILLTPLQLANVAAIIANRGYYLKPHLIRTINKEIDQKWLSQFTKRFYTKIDPQHFETVISGMSKVLTPGGTANGTGIKGIEICGKTGTAQNPHGKDHSLFIAFAPRVNPKIAVAVIVENAGFGSTYAAPISNLVIEKYLKPDTLTSVPHLLDRLKSSHLEQ
jgi:penicillin-binding protein 2